MQGNRTHPGMCESRCTQYCKSACCAHHSSCTVRPTWKDNQRSSYWVCAEGCRGPSMVSAVAENSGLQPGVNLIFQFFLCHLSHKSSCVDASPTLRVGERR
jgi:hypothetical protein